MVSRTKNHKSFGRLPLSAETHPRALRLLLPRPPGGATAHAWAGGKGACTCRCSLLIMSYTTIMSYRTRDLLVTLQHTMERQGLSLLGIIHSFTSLPPTRALALRLPWRGIKAGAPSHLLPSGTDAGALAESSAGVRERQTAAREATLRDSSEQQNFENQSVHCQRYEDSPKPNDESRRSHNRPARV